MKCTRFGASARLAGRSQGQEFGIWPPAVEGGLLFQGLSGPELWQRAGVELEKSLGKMGGAHRMETDDRVYEAAYDAGLASELRHIYTKWVCEGRDRAWLEALRRSALCYGVVVAPARQFWPAGPAQNT